MRLAIVTSHPIQYNAPLFRRLALRIDLDVYFAHRATPEDQSRAGFNRAFEWDVDLLSGYGHTFLVNVSTSPSTACFSGCDTPGIADRISGGGYDAVLVFGWYLKSYVQAIVAAKRSGIPVLVRGDSHLGMPSTLLKHAIKRVMFPIALKVFDAMLYVGQRSLAFYRHHMVPQHRLFFSPHCVDAEWFSARATTAAGRQLRVEHGMTPDEVVVLFAGKLIDFKRPLDVVDAAAALTSRGLAVTVLVAGSGFLEDAMRNRARDLGVKFVPLGFRNQSEMPSCYAAADMLALPSNGSETWGLVANEALACGCPVVLSDEVGCADDLAGDGSAGRVYPFGDINALASALSSVRDRPPTAAGMAAKSDAYGIDAACSGIITAAETVGARHPRS